MKRVKKLVVLVTAIAMILSMLNVAGLATVTEYEKGYGDAGRITKISEANRSTMGVKFEDLVGTTIDGSVVGADDYVILNTVTEAEMENYINFGNGLENVYVWVENEDGSISKLYGGTGAFAGFKGFANTDAEYALSSVEERTPLMYAVAKADAIGDIANKWGGLYYIRPFSGNTITYGREDLDMSGVSTFTYTIGYNFAKDFTGGGVPTVSAYIAQPSKTEATFKMFEVDGAGDIRNFSNSNASGSKVTIQESYSNSDNYYRVIVTVDNTGATPKAKYSIETYQGAAIHTSNWAEIPADTFDFSEDMSFKLSVKDDSGKNRIVCLGHYSFEAEPAEIGPGTDPEEPGTEPEEPGTDPITGIGVTEYEKGFGYKARISDTTSDTMGAKFNSLVGKTIDGSVVGSNDYVILKTVDPEKLNNYKQYGNGLENVFTWIENADGTISKLYGGKGSFNGFNGEGFTGTTPSGETFALSTTTGAAPMMYGAGSDVLTLGTGEGFYVRPFAGNTITYGREDLDMTGISTFTYKIAYNQPTQGGLPKVSGYIAQAEETDETFKIFGIDADGTIRNFDNEAATELKVPVGTTYTYVEGYYTVVVTVDNTGATPKAMFTINWNEENKSTNEFTAKTHTSEWKEIPADTFDFSKVMGFKLSISDEAEKNNTVVLGYYSFEAEPAEIGPGTDPEEPGTDPEEPGTDPEPEQVPGVTKYQKGFGVAGRINKISTANYSTMGTKFDSLVGTTIDGSVVGANDHVILNTVTTTEMENFISGGNGLENVYVWVQDAEGNFSKLYGGAGAFNKHKGYANTTPNAEYALSSVDGTPLMYGAGTEATTSGTGYTFYVRPFAGNTITYGREDLNMSGISTFTYKLAYNQPNQGGLPKVSGYIAQAEETFKIFDIDADGTIRNFDNEEATELKVPVGTTYSYEEGYYTVVVTVDNTGATPKAMFTINWYEENKSTKVFTAKTHTSEWKEIPADAFDFNKNMSFKLSISDEAKKNNTLVMGYYDYSTKILGEDNYKETLTIKNESSAKITNAKRISAIYDLNGALVNCEIADVAEIAKGSTVLYETTMTPNDEMTAMTDFVVKHFLWDGFDSLKPLGAMDSTQQNSVIVCK